MKINLGCGFDKQPGYLNVDSFPGCKPDFLMNIEDTPWPIASDSVQELLAKHVLEHIGRDPAVFFAVLKEIYRVMKPDGTVRIMVPHHLHPNFFSDPTHVRAFTPLTFQMMSRKVCEDWVARSVGNTVLALMLNIDFEMTSLVQIYDRRWMSKVEAGEMTKEALREAGMMYAGVIRELRVELKAVKAAA